MLYASRSDAEGGSKLLHSEGFGLRKAALVSIFAGLVVLSACANPSSGQEPGGLDGVKSFGFSTTYSPNSTHILIGESEDRHIWTVGFEYTHLLRQNPYYRLDYEGSIMPVWEEIDPTVTGTVFTSGGSAIVTPQTPVRVVDVAHGPVGTILTASGAIVPLYAQFSRENTYAAALSPLGARITALPRWRVQPSFSIDMGFILSARDLPVDDSARFNYLFSCGPGIEFFGDAKTSWRVEYLYRHFSNAGQGDQNPGVDQGVIRVTVSVHR
jgi:hypothetical protein